MKLRWQPRLLERDEISKRLTESARRNDEQIACGRNGTEHRQGERCLEDGAHQRTMDCLNPGINVGCAAV